MCLSGLQLADVLLTVDVAQYSTLGFDRAAEIIQRGYEAAQAKANVLSAFSLPEAEWNRYLAQRNVRRIDSLPVPQFVDVTGTSSKVAAGIENRMSPFINQSIDTAGLTRQITREMGLGLFNSMSYGLISHDGENGLEITAEEKEYLPPWLKPGFEIDGSDPNNIQVNVGGRITFTGIGGYRSEIRTDFSFGSTYAASAEYYHPLTSTTRWFIAAQAGALRKPWNLYDKEDFVAEYRLNNVEGQFEAGYTFDRFSQLQFGYQIGYVEDTRYIGSPDLPTVSGRTGFSGGTYVLDRLDQPIIPRQGIGLTLNAGWHDTYPGARNPFPSAEISFEIFQRLSDPGSIYLQLEGASTFGHQNTGLPLLLSEAPHGSRPTVLTNF